MVAKKIVRIIIFVGSLFIFSIGCATEPETTPPIAGTTEVLVIDPNQESLDLDREVVATQPLKIAFMTKAKSEEEILDSLWLTAIYDAAQQASEDFNVSLEFVYSGCTDLTIENGEDCAEAQIRVINALIEQGDIDGLVLIPLESNRLVPVVEKVINSGIPVITYDTPLNSDKLLTAVAFNNFEAAELMGEWVQAQLEPKSNVLILEGNRTNANANQRKDGFLSGLGTGDINILGLETGNWDDREGRAITNQWLETHEDIDGILAANDSMAIGAAQAVRAAGRTGILITGFDANTAALEEISAGRIGATIDQTPGLQTRIAIQLMVRHLENGDQFPSVVSLPKIVLINQENITDYYSP